MVDTRRKEGQVAERAAQKRKKKKKKRWCVKVSANNDAHCTAKTVRN